MSDKGSNIEKLSQHEKDLKRLEEFTLLDDDFMTAVFADNLPSVQYVLDVILGIPKAPPHNSRLKAWWHNACIFSVILHGRL